MATPAVAIGLLAALPLAVPALAEDPPGRVGSLNYVSGEVSYALRGEGEPEASDALTWNQADFDQPVCEDMSLRTGDKARARIRIGPDAIEMSDDTALNVLNLTEKLIEASVRQGRIYVQVDKLAAGESVEIEIPRGSLWLLQPGGYDIAVGTADQPARITVFDGKARFVGGVADAAVAAGEEVQITGTYPNVTTTEGRSSTALPAAARTPVAQTPVAQTPVAQTPVAQTPVAQTPVAQTPAAPTGTASAPEAGPAEDDHATAGQTAPVATSEQASSSYAEPATGPSDNFLYFVAESNSDPEAAQSAHYVSSATTGYDELDRYGHWETLPDSEAVWFPDSVPADWAPYRFGHWDSIAPWGWTWVDDEPWGFAPFHYGRWINLDGRWGWVPGAVASDPVYAPALVAFVDTGDQAGGPDGPDVGWFPLGPGDAYVPWYVAGPAYIERVNVAAHGAAGAGLGREAWRGPYANKQFATAVSRRAFADGRPVQEAMARFPRDRLAQAAVMRGAPHVTAMARRLSGPERAGGRPAPGAEHAGSPAARQQEGGRAAFSRNAPEHGGMAPHERAAMARSPAEAHRGGAQQFAHPAEFRNAGGGYRGAAPQFRQPEMFHTPASAFGSRSFQTPQFGARPAAMHFGGGGGVSVSHHR